MRAQISINTITVALVSCRSLAVVCVHFVFESEHLPLFVSADYDTFTQKKITIFTNVPLFVQIVAHSFHFDLHRHNVLVRGKIHL